jgi:signal transduction histidine kinase
VSERLRVLGVIGFASLPLLLLAAINLFQSISEGQERVSTERVGLAQAAALTASQSAQADLRTLRSAARAAEVRTADVSSDIDAELAEFLDPDSNLDQIALFDADGSNLGSTDAAMAPRSLNVTDRAYFQQALAEGVSVSSPSVLSRIDGRPVIVLAVAVDFRSGKRGVLAGTISFQRLRDDLRSYLEERGLTITVLDSEGQVIVSPDDALTRVPTSLRGRGYVERGLRGEAGSEVITEAGTVPQLVAYAPVPATGWLLLIEQPTTIAFEAANRESSSVLGLVIIAAMLAFAIAVYLGTRLSEFYERESLARAESERAAAELRLVTSESEQRRRFLERLIVSAPVAIGITQGPEHRYVTVNPRYQLLKPGVDMVGLTVREVFPEVVEQGVVEWLDDVYTGGRQFTAVDQERSFGFGPTNEADRYFTIVYAPYDDADGRTEGVLIIALETTEAVRARLRAEQQKDEFLSTASHELKTPLTGLALSAQMIERVLNRQENADERVKRSVASMIRQVYRASELINDLLEVSRLQRGAVARQERLNFSALVAAAIEQTEDALPEETSIGLVANIAPVVMVDGDESRLDQVLTNLLSNAVKYSPDGGEIWINLIDRPSELELRIDDQGMGVPEDERDELFRPFSRATTARDSGIEGTGLGLYISRQIVEVHGGTIRYEPSARGGSTFVVILPKHASRDRDNVAPQVEVPGSAPAG